MRQVLKGWFLLLLVLQGCVLFEARAPAPTPRPTPTPTPVPERFLHVSKAQRRLTVYEANTVVATFPIVLGKDPVRAKLHQGDHRTPEGEYHISKKYHHAGWARFMLLSYPTDSNQELYTWAAEHDVLPRRHGRLPGIGGAV